MKDNDYVLQWSFKQRCWHIETVDDMLRSNLRAFAENRELEYIPVAIGITHKTANELSRMLEASGSQAGKDIAEKWGPWRQ